MEEYKVLTLAVFDKSGKIHKIKIEKTEGDKAIFDVKGDTQLLSARLETMKRLLTEYLKGLNNATD